MTAVATYRLEWWLPLAAEPGEWTGRWRRFADADRLRDAALAAIDDGAALGLVLVTGHASDGSVLARAAPDADELRGWDPASGALPAAASDPSMLPPQGREDVEVQTLARCRDALLVAHEADLLDRLVVTAILEVIQQAFQGIGAAVQAAAAIDREIECATRVRAS